MTNEIFSIQDFSDEELVTILSCAKPSDLRNHFSGKKYESMMTLIKRYKTKKSDNPIGSALMKTLDEKFLSYPTYALSTMTGLLTLGFVPLTMVTGGITLAMLGSASVYYLTSYFEEKNIAEKDYLTREFLHFKNEVADEAITRASKQIDLAAAKKKLENHPGLHLKSLDPKDFHPDELPLAKQFIGSTLMLSMLLFQSYYLTTHALLLGLGIASLAAPMVGVVGLTLAATAVLGVSLYLSYKQYEAKKESEFNKHVDRHLSNNIKAKKEFSEELQKIKKENDKKAENVDEVEQSNPAEMKKPKQVVVLKEHGTKKHRHHNDLKPQERHPFFSSGAKNDAQKAQEESLELQELDAVEKQRGYGAGN